MQWIVIARDGTDPGAPARRQAVRGAHLEGIAPRVEAGGVLLGGALLDDDGGMVGSVIVFEAEDEAEARRLVDSDVYAREGVWVSYELHPFRRAV